MSDTPQNDVTPTDFNQPEGDIETNDSVPASETGEQAQAESEVQVDEVELAKKKTNEAFNKQYGEKKQLERDLASQKAELEKLQQAERDRQAAIVGNIPPMPDSFDDDYEAKVRARDEAIAAQASFNTQNQVYLQQQETNRQREAQAKQNELAQLASKFTANAKELGATDEEFNSVITTLNNAGMPSDLGQVIMSDPDGYLIAKHLMANPIEAHEVITANPYIVGAKLVEIKSKASALKPKTSNAPQPATNLSGNGIDPELGQYKNINGAKFE